MQDLKFYLYLMIQSLREKQKDRVTNINKQNCRVTVVNESVSIMFDVLVFTLTGIKCSKKTT